MGRSFEEQVDILGGTLDAESLDDPCRMLHMGVRDFLDTDVRVWQREFVEFDLEWINSEHLTGLAGKRCDGGYAIGMSYGTAISLQEVFYAMLGNPAFMATTGRSSLERVPLQDLPEDIGRKIVSASKTEWRVRPRCHYRRRVARWMTETATLFLLYHELAHVIRGHVDYVQTQRFSFLQDHPTVNYGKFPLRRHLEDDADAVGVDLLLQVRSIDLFKGTAKTRRKLLTWALIAIGTIFAIFDDEMSSVANYESDSYSHPLHRFFNVMDVTGASAVKELALSAADVRQAAKSAILELQTVAASLGFPPDRWKTPTASAWQIDLHERRKAERKAILEELFGDRSTLSDELIEKLNA